MAEIGYDLAHLRNSVIHNVRRELQGIADDNGRVDMAQLTGTFGSQLKDVIPAARAAAGSAGTVRLEAIIDAYERDFDTKLRPFNSNEPQKLTYAELARFSDIAPNMAARVAVSLSAMDATRRPWNLQREYAAKGGSTVGDPHRQVRTPPTTPLAEFRIEPWVEQIHVDGSMVHIKSSSVPTGWATYSVAGGSGGWGVTRLAPEQPDDPRRSWTQHGDQDWRWDFPNGQSLSIDPSGGTLHGPGGQTSLTWPAYLGEPNEADMAPGGEHLAVSGRRDIAIFDKKPDGSWEVTARIKHGFDSAPKVGFSNSDTIIAGAYRHPVRIFQVSLEPEAPAQVTVADSDAYAASETERAARALAAQKARVPKQLPIPSALNPRMFTAAAQEDGFSSPNNGTDLRATYTKLEDVLPDVSVTAAQLRPFADEHLRFVGRALSDQFGRSRPLSLEDLRNPEHPAVKRAERDYVTFDVEPQTYVIRDADGTEKGVVFLWTLDWDHEKDYYAVLYDTAAGRITGKAEFTSASGEDPTYTGL